MIQYDIIMVLWYILYHHHSCWTLGPKGTQGDPRGPKGTQGDPRGPKGTQGDPRGPKGTQGDPRGPKGTQGDPRGPKATGSHGTVVNLEGLDLERCLTTLEGQGTSLPDAEVQHGIPTWCTGADFIADPSFFFGLKVPTVSYKQIQEVGP